MSARKSEEISALQAWMRVHMPEDDPEDPDTIDTLMSRPDLASLLKFFVSKDKTPPKPPSSSTPLGISATDVKFLLQDKGRKYLEKVSIFQTGLVW